MRVDYLCDGPSPAAEWFRTVAVVPEVRAIGSFLITATLVIACSWSFERIQVHHESAEVNMLRARVARGGVIASRVRAELRGVGAWEALDRRIREIRESGNATAWRLVHLANTLPGETWLTAVTTDARGVAATGRAVNIAAVTEALHRIRGSQLVDVRGLEAPMSHIVEFQVHIPTQ